MLQIETAALAGVAKAVAQVGSLQKRHAPPTDFQRTRPAPAPKQQRRRCPRRRRPPGQACPRAAPTRACSQVARLVGASWRDVVPVVNATTGVNAAVGSVPLGRGDLLLMTNATYPAVRGLWLD